MNPIYRSPRRFRTSNDSSLVVAFVSIFLVVVFVFSIDRISGGAVRGYARQGGGAMWAAVSSVTGVVTESGLLNSKRSLVEENKQLRAAIATRDEQALRFETLQEENAALRGILGLVNNDGITVPVLSSFDSSPYGTFRVGGGAAAGVEEGSIVLTPGGFVLGSVTFVSARTATVESFFTANKEIEMQVRGVTFSSEGRGGGNARGEIPRAATVREGDVVIVPAFGGRPAGIIGKVESASSSAYTTLFIRIPTNLDALRYVYVLPLQ